MSSLSIEIYFLIIFVFNYTLLIISYLLYG